MQIYIDLAAEPIAALYLHADFVRSYAELRAALERNGGSVPAGTSAGPLVAELPPPPPTGNAGGAAIPGTSNVTTIVPPTSSLMPAPASLGASAVANAAASAAASNGPAAVVYDSAGVPWDARIHQVKQGQKKDGTWKLQKGIADAVVAQVMQELAPYIRAPQAPTLGMPPPATGAALPPPPPASPPSAGSLPPPPPGLPLPPASPTESGFNAQAPFPALVAKITAARQAGKVSPEELTRLYAEAGAPSLQALNALPDALHRVSLALDVLLTTR